MLRNLVELRWSVLFAALVGVLAAPAGQTWWRSMQTAYDEARPVVKMAGVLVRRSGDQVYIRMSGEKLRACSYLRVQAFSRAPDGRLSDAYIQRDDKPERGDTKPIGSFDMGIWRAWPVLGAVGVLVFVQHDCDGRLVLTKIADVEI